MKRTSSDWEEMELVVDHVVKNRSVAPRRVKSMGVCKWLSVVLVLLFAVFIGRAIHKLSSHVEPPVMAEPYWGPGDAKPDNEALRPIKISVQDSILKDLKYRLDNHREFTKPLEGVAQTYGMNSNTLKEIVDFWRTKYDWRAREKYLNKYPHFKTQIQGLDIHYIHVKPEVTEGVKVLPLLALHGWPGSIREFYELIPLLTQKRDGYDFVFEVIVASLPGFGFSSAAAKPGLGSAEMAVVFKNLMERLGFEKWYAQGGDFGAITLNNMAALYGDKKLLGLHSNFCLNNNVWANVKWLVGSLCPTYFAGKGFKDRMYPISKIFKKILRMTGYLHIQATTPDTIGIAIDDSPVGLASYILEKFSGGTNPAFALRDDAGLKHYKYEDLLDNVMIYWVTHSMTTAFRLYSETFNEAQTALNLDRVAINIPVACAKFPYEILHQSDWILKDRFTNLVHSVNIPKGGHFAAFEVPEILADDIFVAIKKMEALRKQ